MNQAKQLSLNLRFDQQLSWQSISITDANAQAVEFLKRFPWDTDDVFWVLCGPMSSGKSTLAKLWAHTWQAWCGTEGQWIDLLSILPLQGSCFVVDDFHFEDKDEEALWNLYMLLQHMNGRMLVTSHSPPASWGIKTPDLHTRIVACKQLLLRLPDDDQLLDLLARQMRSYGFSLATTDSEKYAPIWSYCLMRAPRTYDAIMHLAKLLHDEALARHSDLTIPLAKRALERLFEHDQDKQPAQPSLF